ncbi:hypothetical protein DFH28DRAFT_829137, partial [Melampsora americana]
QPERFASRNLSYAAVQRFAGLYHLSHYLDFADLSPSMSSKCIWILSGHEIKSFHVFLFPDIISAKQLCDWGIPFGVACEIILHAEAYYLELSRREGNSRS